MGWKHTWASFNGALMFYTCLPIPRSWPIAFAQAARWVPWVGGLIGALLALTDLGLQAAHMPEPVKSGLVVAFGIAITGGLHLDGAMDTADGLAVLDPDRRLAVMADSRMGAFGGIAVVVILLLKIVALGAVIAENRPFVLVSVAMWGRWGQQWAIARYPYLKKEGKGALHKAALPSIKYVLPSLFGLLLLSGIAGAADLVPKLFIWRTVIGGIVLSLLTSAYFSRQLGGHTGDTYGAVVEWTETLLFCILAAGTG